MAKTTLISASNKGDIPKMLECLKNGENPNTRNNRGYFALAGAVNSGNIEAVKLLLTHKANVNMKSEYHWTPLYTALKRWESGPIQQAWGVPRRNYLKIAKLLLTTKGLNPTTPVCGGLYSREGDTALHIAVRKRNYTLIKKILATGKAKNSLLNNDLCTVQGALRKKKNYKLACYLMINGIKPLSKTFLHI